MNYWVLELQPPTSDALGFEIGSGPPSHFSTICPSRFAQKWCKGGRKGRFSAFARVWRGGAIDFSGLHPKISPLLEPCRQGRTMHWKVGAHVLRGTLISRNWPLFKLQRGPLPNDLWNVGGTCPLCPLFHTSMFAGASACMYKAKMNSYLTWKQNSVFSLVLFDTGGSCKKSPLRISWIPPNGLLHFLIWRATASILSK